MSRNLTSFLLIALLASGCSFVQNWGEYRGEGMDGGTGDAGTDAGTGDAGFDAGSDCDFCEEEGCAGQPECVIEDADMCFHCDFSGSLEGEQCLDDGECAGALICELRLCLYECGTRDDCLGLSSIGEECVFGYERQVCLNHECDPVYMECLPEQPCFVGVSDDGTEEVATICSYPRGGIVPEGGSCLPPDEVCEDGLVCLDPMGTGAGMCLRWCYTDEAACDAGRFCVPILGPSGTPLRYLGRELGACASGDCDPADPSTCPAGEVCRDDGTGMLSCGPGRCTVDADCPWPGRCEPAAAVCIVDCSGDFDCIPDGFSRCIPVTVAGTVIQACVNDCSPGEMCPDGSFCSDLDADGIGECLP